ncbi:DUF3791 domain-containing protein [Treponema sp.]|uniref:DUF3791 domain-containing protein n=1 Tax=Treponema sp. TaxID=166 RepID=UPI00389012AD
MSEVIGEKKEDDLFLIQIRLFRLAQNKWNLDEKECSNLFNKYKIYDYIETCYEFFHLQGDEANLTDIENYLKNNGAEI